MPCKCLSEFLWYYCGTAHAHFYHFFFVLLTFFFLSSPLPRRLQCEGSAITNISKTLSCCLHLSFLVFKQFKSKLKCNNKFSVSVWFSKEKKMGGVISTQSRIAESVWMECIWWDEGMKWDDPSRCARRMRTVAIPAHPSVHSSTLLTSVTIPKSRN